jgi:membrane-bound lytic murein transglycosylase D
LDNFWDLYERLPRETARYVPRFLATLHILQNLNKYGLKNVKVDPPLTYERVPITQSVHLRDVARKIGESEKTMRGLNPELRYKIVPQGTYPLRVPIGKKQILLASLDDIPIASKPQTAYISHRVRRGDTLGKIAGKYRTSIKSIARANRINQRNHIVVGQKLKIPRSGVVVYKTKIYKKTKTVPTTTHVVKGGDSLWNIAKRYGTTTKQIQYYNNLRSSRLRIGQVLKVPKTESEIPPKEAFKTYRVRRGDSPFRISKTHNMELERFLRINRLTPRSKIYPGQNMFVE